MQRLPLDGELGDGEQRALRRVLGGRRALVQHHAQLLYCSLQLLKLLGAGCSLRVPGPDCLIMDGTDAF